MLSFLLGASLAVTYLSKQQRFSSETGLIAACGFAPKGNPQAADAAQ
jgi:hypothetical protein